MLGIVLIYFIGKKFYDLADNYKKNQWLYGILGVVSYYAGTFILGIFLGLYYEFGSSSGSIDDLGDLGLSLIAIPAGLLSCYIFYTLLERNWEKNKPLIDTTSINEIGRDDKI